MLSNIKLDQVKCINNFVRDKQINQNIMKILNRIILLILALISHALMYAQVTVTVPNPSFERTSSGSGSVAIANYASSQWYNCGGGTFDIMHGDGLWGVNKTANHQDYYGFMLFPTNNVANTESMTADLSTPFVANLPYSFSIDISSMKRGSGACAVNGNSYTNQYLDVEVELYGTNACGMDELLWASGPISHCDWQNYAGVITPSAAYTQIQWRIKYIDAYALGLPAGWQRMYAIGVDDMSDFVPLNTLSAELSAFDVQCDTDSPLLTWETISENNCDYFEIEYAEDGIEFVSIGTVSAAGNSSSLKPYQFNVDGRYSKGYFRLKQVDYNGAFKYSKVVMAHCNQNTIFAYLSGDDIIISSDEIIQGVQIVDMMGKILYTGTEYQISTTDFSHGTYIVRVSSQSGMKSIKIMK